MSRQLHTRNPAANQLVLVLAFAASGVLGLALTVLLGRGLAPADFGFFALVTTLFAFARDAIDLGSSATASRDMARDPGGEKQLLEGLWYARRIIALVLAAVAVALAFTQPDRLRLWIMLAAAVVLANLGRTAFNALFQARQALVAPALAAFGTQLLLFVACIALLARGNAGAETALALVGREALALVAIAWLGRRLLGERVSPRPNYERIRGFYLAAGIWAAATLCRHLLPQVDVLAVYLLRGSEELGAWASAYRLLAPVLALPWMLVIPLVPVFAVLGSSQAGTELFASTALLCLGAGVLATTCTIAAAPDLIAVLYGAKYSAPPLDSVPAMRWIALALTPAFLIELGAAGLLVAGRVRIVLAISAVALACKIVAIAALVPTHGFVMAAAITGVTEIAVAAALFMALRLDWASLAKGIPVALAPAAVAAALCIAATRWIETPPVRLAAMIAAGVIALAMLMRTATGRDYFRCLGKARAAVPAT